MEREMSDEELIARLRGAGKHPMMDGNCKVDVYDVHDAADRIEALVARADLAPGVKVKPLEWRETNDGNHRKGEVYSARSPISFAPIAAYKKHDGWWLNIECRTYPTLEAAKTAAQADYEAHIMAALDLAPAPDPAKVQALVEAFRKCVDDLDLALRDGYEGVWIEDDFAEHLAPYRAALAAWEGRG
jgi:hypothetical protein